MGKKKHNRSQPIKNDRLEEVDEEPASNSDIEKLEDNVVNNTGEDEEPDQFKMKFQTLLDYIQATKCEKLRLNHWKSLCETLATRYCFDYLEDHQFTLMDIFERGLKGSGEEIERTALTVALTLINFGNSGDFSETILDRFNLLLERYLADPTLKPLARARCAMALAFGYFITETNDKNRVLINQLLNFGFLRVHPKNSSLNDFNNFQLICLEMFALLASVEADNYKQQLLFIHIDKFKENLNSPNVMIRVSTGESIALLLDCANVDKFKESQDVMDLCDQLDNLTTQYQKSQSKRQLRLQRNHFRQINKSILADFVEPEFVHFGIETLTLDTWTLKVQYESLCSLIGNGIHLHLKHNPLLRDIFGLGLVLLEQPIESKGDRVQRHNMHTANRKCREMSRNKLRIRRQQSLYE